MTLKVLNIRLTLKSLTFFEVVVDVILRFNSNMVFINVLSVQQGWRPRGGSRLGGVIHRFYFHNWDKNIPLMHQMNASPENEKNTDYLLRVLQVRWSINYLINQ